MHKLLLLISMGMLMAAQTPNTPPVATTKPEPLKRVPLDELDQVKVENLTLKLRLMSDPFNREINSHFEKACIKLGGTTLGDCLTFGPTQNDQAAPYSVALKPGAPPRPVPAAEPAPTSGGQQ